jgi:ATP-dependent Lhr-like helicase
VVFITKGQLWRVLDMGEGRITVEPARRVKGELPSWEGEQIPVPFAVAREVGSLRRTRDFESYHAGDEPSRFAGRFLSEMDRNRSVVATDRLIVIEDAREGIVCNICAGHKANEALGRVLSVLLSARYGTTVGIELGAYRILLRLPGHVKGADVRELLMGLDPGHTEGILQLALKRTALFKWKLVQIAKKFGAIDQDADYERLSSYKLTELFEGTVVQKETYRELFSVYMDTARAEQVLDEVRKGQTGVETGRISILGAEGLFSSRDMIAPTGPDQAVISTLRKRIENQDIILACMNCRKWKSRTVVSRVQESPVCPKCGARLIAVLKPWEESLYAIVGRKEKSEEERSVELRLLRNANIVLSGGKKAVTALAAKGVGPEIASRILATLAEGDAFFREILKAERNYIRTHRYW